MSFCAYGLVFPIANWQGGVVRGPVWSGSLVGGWDGCPWRGFTTHYCEVPWTGSLLLVIGQSLRRVHAGSGARSLLRVDSLKGEQSRWRVQLEYRVEVPKRGSLVRKLKRSPFGGNAWIRRKGYLRSGKFWHSSCPILGPGVYPGNSICSLDVDVP